MIMCIESLKTTTNRQNMGDPSVVRKVEDMTVEEQRHMESLKKQAHRKHGFALAHEYDDYVLSGKRHHPSAALIEAIPPDAPYSNPVTGYNIKDILERIK